jgi:hypothetical protein
MLPLEHSDTRTLGHSDTRTLSLCPFSSYAKLKVKVSVNFTQTKTEIYELFHRPFGNHASDLSANLCSPDDF